MTALHGRRPRFAGRGMALAACMVAATGSPFAQVAPPFTELYRQTQDSPRQVELNADVNRAEGLARQTRARPNPTVSLTTENFAGQQPFGGFSQSEDTIQISQPFELPGKRRSRIAAGDAGVAAARARAHEERIAYAYDLARAYAGAEIADRHIELAQDEVEEAEADLAAARALVDAGKEARLRSLRAETEVNAQRVQLDTARAERIGAYARLSALAGQATSYSALAEPMLERLAPVTGAGPIDPLQTAPYLAAKADSAAAATRAVAAGHHSLPDVTVSVGVRRLAANSANAFVAGVSVPLPLFDRNRGNVDAAQAELRGAQAREAAARLETRAAIAGALALNDAADARALAADRSRRLAEEAYRLARIAYEAGKSPLMELLAARHGLGAARDALLDARTAQFEARASLARLEGRTVTGEVVP